MNDTECMAEVEEGIKTSILAIMRNPKEKPKDKLKAGLEYYRRVTTTELQKINTVTQVASLYSPEQRQEILKNLLPPMSNIVALDIEFISKSEKKQLTDTLSKRNKDVDDLTRRCQSAENKLADVKDEKAVIEKPALTKAAQQEYELKRNF